jgi:type I restriction-modification system specificity subunit
MKRQITIGEIAEINANSLTQKDMLQEIMYLDTGNITRNEIDNIQVLNVMMDKIPSRAKRKVKDKTIIYSTVRPNQEHYGFLENPSDNFIVSTGFSTIDVCDKDTDGKFIYYLLTQKHITDYLHTIGENSVSSYPSINPDDIANLKFAVPDFKTQQSIAAILSVLDKKIALNKQINTRLEEMAKTLYDYWFVQFDFPDANGKPYKSSGGEMVFDETLKREIPKGWEVKSLNQVADIVMGQSPDGASYNLEQEGTIFFQGSTDFDWRFPNVRQYTTSPTRFAQKGDILLSVRAPVGDLNIAPFECCIGRGLAALRSKSGNNSFLFYVMKYFKTVFERRNTEGTTFGSITKDDLHSLKLVAPADNVLEKYNEIASKYDEMIFIRSQQNHQLTQLRDFLLPMLMNGQISVTCSGARDG